MHSERSFRRFALTVLVAVAALGASFTFTGCALTGQQPYLVGHNYLDDIRQASTQSSFGTGPAGRFAQNQQQPQTGYARVPAMAGQSVYAGSRYDTRMQAAIQQDYEATHPVVMPMNGGSLGPDGSVVNTAPTATDRRRLAASAERLHHVEETVVRLAVTQHEHGARLDRQEQATRAQGETIVRMARTRHRSRHHRADAGHVEEAPNAPETPAPAPQAAPPSDEAIGPTLWTSN